MIRLALSFLAATVLATGGWSTFGKAVSPSQPQLRVIAHVYSHPHRESVSALHTSGTASGQVFY
jgi:hypothetical protein